MKKCILKYPRLKEGEILGLALKYFSKGGGEKKV